MSEGKGSQWFRQFKDDQTNMRDEDHGGRMSVMCDNLAEKVNKIRENWQFPISGINVFSTNFTYITLYEIVSEKLHYHKVCARRMPKMLTDTNKKQSTISALRFFQQYNNKGAKFVYHIVNGDETWISFSK
jgi:hypothetical protein